VLTQAAERRNAAPAPAFRESAKVAEVAKSANYILLAFLSDASVIARGADDLRSAFLRTHKCAVVGRGATGRRVEMSKSDRRSDFRA
jgi:hypothetical protein